MRAAHWKLPRLFGAGMLAMTLSATALKAADDAKPEPPGGYKVGFVTADVGLAFYASMKCAADKTAAANKITLIWQGSQSISPRDEMQVLQAVAAQKPDGILLVPWDSTAFIAPTKDLIAGGTPVITVDGNLAEPVDISNIRTNNRDAGSSAAKDLAEMIGGKGGVLILSASPGDGVQNDRWKGFKEVLDKNYKDIKVLDVQYIGADASKAASITASVIAANPDLAAIYTTMDAGAEGAVNAVRAAGKQGKIRIVGFDATLHQVELLKGGELDALVAQNTGEIGTKMVEMMVKVLQEGRQKAALPQEVFTPVKFLTRDNIDAPESKGYIYNPDCGS
jgi:ribose transport system substrate-binding protein